MIAAMPDYERIDRELAAIGSVPEAVQPLLDEYGQRDRSLENVDQVLAALHEGRDPGSTPPEPGIERPSFLPLGWDAERHSDPGAEPAAVVASERDEVTVNTGAPEEIVASPASASAHAQEPNEDAEPIDTQQASPPPPVEEPAPGHSPSLGHQSMHRSSRPPRPDIAALLDEELDPREFPSTHPPPARASVPASTPLLPIPSSSRPPLSSSSPAEAEEADFELLVDDDDILEIDED